MLKALFVLEMFTFLFWLFGYVEKRLDKERFQNSWRQRLDELASFVTITKIYLLTQAINWNLINIATS